MVLDKAFRLNGKSVRNIRDIAYRHDTVFPHFLVPVNDTFLDEFRRCIPFSNHITDKSQQARSGTDDALHVRQLQMAMRIYESGYQSALEYFYFRWVKIIPFSQFQDFPIFIDNDYTLIQNTIFNGINLIRRYLSNSFHLIFLDHSQTARYGYC